MHFRGLRIVVTLLSPLVLALPARAATPRAELLRLVPADVGFCLVLEDLRGHGQALAESPFVRNFGGSPVGARFLGTPEAQKLTELDGFLQKLLGVTPAQLRDEILGDAIVLAYRPGPPGTPEREQGLFLLRARDPRLLATLVDRLNDLQKSTGDLSEIVKVPYPNGAYLRRTDRHGTHFYFLHGTILAMSPQEDLLKQVIDREVVPVGASESTLEREFRLLGMERALASLWVNPRAFEPALAARLAGAAGPERKSLETLLGYWKALDGLAVTVRLDKDLELSLAARGRSGDLPEPARRFLRAAAQPSDLWTAFPGDAILVAGSRVDVPALIDLFSQFLDEDARKAVRTSVEQSVGTVLGPTFLKDLLPWLGPDWGVCVVAPPGSDAAWFPHAVVGLRVRRGNEGVPADVALTNALNSLATLAVVSSNQGKPGSLTLRIVLQGATEVRFLADDKRFPPGLQPGFAAKGGYILFGSSPDALRRFTPPATPRRPSAGPTLLFRLSLRQLRAYLAARKDAFVAYAVTRDGADEEHTRTGLEKLIGVLALLDRIELRQHAQDDRVELSLHIVTEQPLR